MDEGNRLKKDQIDKLIEYDFNNLYPEYQSTPVLIKMTPKKRPTSGCITSKNMRFFFFT
jgi:hypothetical protein